MRVFVPNTNRYSFKKNKNTPASSSSVNHNNTNNSTNSTSSNNNTSNNSNHQQTSPVEANLENSELEINANTKTKTAASALPSVSKSFAARKESLPSSPLQSQTNQESSSQSPIGGNTNPVSPTSSKSIGSAHSITTHRLKRPRAILDNSKKTSNTETNRDVKLSASASLSFEAYEHSPKKQKAASVSSSKSTKVSGSASSFRSRSDPYSSNNKTDFVTSSSASSASASNSASEYNLAFSSSFSNQSIQGRDTGKLKKVEGGGDSNIMGGLPATSENEQVGKIPPTNATTVDGSNANVNATNQRDDPECDPAGYDSDHEHEEELQSLPYITKQNQNEHRPEHKHDGKHRDKPRNQSKHPQSQSEQKLQPKTISFGEALKKRGLEEVEQEGDGNCLFRAVSLQVYGDSDMHMDVRRRCMDFMAKDQAHFSQFIDQTSEPFEEYILRKRLDGVHGNNPEIQAISELYNRPVEVFIPSNGAASPINIFQSEYKTGDAPIRLAYHDGNHYNAVIDPVLPTAGLGLGLPGLEPGLADKLQMQRATEESDQFFVQKMADDAHKDEIRRAMEESKQTAMASEFQKIQDYEYQKKAALGLSMGMDMGLAYKYGGRGRGKGDDLEETRFEMEQAALLSSLESYQRMEGSRKQSSWDRGGGTSAGGQQGRGSGRYSSHGRGRGRGRGNHEAESNISGSRYHSISSSSSRHCDNNTGSSSSNRTFARRSLSPSGEAASTSVSAGATSSMSAATARGRHEDDIPLHLLQHDQDLNQGGDEYPQTVQELVMNGFELQKVLKAYDLIGNNFDDLLAFLMTSSGS